LPQVCPSCSGPIRGHEVKWTGPQSANCPYCGTNLPMNKA
jgi:primosomal protein N'